MKKFAFLLALIAVFAMSAAAWAAEPDEAKWVKSLTPNTSGSINMGNFVQVTAPDKSPKTDGVYTADVYYFGTLSAAQKAEANIDLTLGAADQNQYYALPEGATFAVGNHTFGNVPVAGQDGREGVLELTSAAKAAYTFGVANSGNTDLDDTVTRAKLTLTPVELIVTAMKDAEDVKDKPFTVKTTDSTFDIVIAGKAGTADTLDLTKVVVKSGDTPVSTSTGDLAQWSYSTGKIAIDPTRAKAGDTLTITVKAPETDSAKVLKTATGTQVAGVTKNTVFATISIKFVDYIVEPASADWDGSTAAEGVKFTVKGLTAEKISKIEIKGSGVGPDVLDAANYTKTTKGSDVEIELKLEYLEGLSKNDYTFTITDDANKTADFVLTVTPKGEKSYAADPSSATWDGTSGVKFKVDMPHSDFNAIGVKSPNEADVRELGKDYYTVTPTADGIEVELKPEYLLSLTATGDYVYYVGDKKGLSALFTLTVTGQGGVIVPAKGVTPQIDAGEAPEGVQFGISQGRMTKDEIVALDRSIGDFLDDDGKIKTDEAASLTRTDPEALTVLPIITASLSEDKTVAAFTFGVNGRALVSEGTSGIKWYDAIIHKMYVGSTGPASVTLAPARTWGAVANGTFMILDVHGAPLPEYHLIERKGTTQYKLVVYVEDNGAYDLDKTNPKTVVDPVAIQKSSGGGSSSSSGACASGAAAFAAIAVLAMIKRRKK